MGKSSRFLDGQAAAYILTLGVLPEHQGRGVARQLLDRVLQHALAAACGTLFLHVITYNSSALRLYERAGYQWAGCLPNFYYINSGRQPETHRLHYDAHLMTLPLPEAAWAPPAWGSWQLPFSSCWGRSCRAAGPSPWMAPLPVPVQHALGGSCLPNREPRSEQHSTLVCLAQHNCRGPSSASGPRGISPAQWAPALGTLLYARHSASSSNKPYLPSSPPVQASCTATARLRNPQPRLRLSSRPAPDAR